MRLFSWRLCRQEKLAPAWFAGYGCLRVQPAAMAV
jgi:hypothetical protein